MVKKHLKKVFTGHGSRARGAVLMSFMPAGTPVVVGSVRARFPKTARIRISAAGSPAVSNSEVACRLDFCFTRRSLNSGGVSGKRRRVIYF